MEGLISRAIFDYLESGGGGEDYWKNPPLVVLIILLYLIRFHYKWKKYCVIIDTHTYIYLYYVYSGKVCAVFIFICYGKP